MNHRCHERHPCAALVIALLLIPLVAIAQNSPPHSVRTELEHLYRLELLPSYRPQTIVGMSSSYDRTGLNDDGFSGKYSYVRKEADGRLVLADLQGPGVVNRIWTPTPTDDMVAFYFDGESTPRLRLRFSDLFSGAVFPFVRPIVGNEAGGFYSYVPLPYQRSLKIVFEGKRILFQQIQHRQFPKNTQVQSFKSEWSAEERAQLETVRQHWLKPDLRESVTERAGVEVKEQDVLIKRGERADLFAMNEGGRIVAMELTPALAFAGSTKDLLLEATWDDEPLPAISSPVADFFGFAYGRAAMRSLVLGTRDDVAYSLLPMPFDKRAKLQLAYEPRDESQTPIRVKARIWFAKQPRDVTREGKLYATWRREIDPALGEPYRLLDVSGRGHHVGTILIAQGLEAGMTGFFEGDDVATIDGEMRLHGTGSEDAFNGGWYALPDRWDRSINLPLHGALDYSVPLARTGGYRFNLTDKSSFENSFRFTIEHGPENNATRVDYTSVAFYYADRPPSSIMRPTSALRVNPEPRLHIYYPQLMKLTMIHGTTVEVLDNLIVRAREEGFVRLLLDELPRGRYRVMLSYYEQPNGAAFSLWQRQRQISEWRSSRGENEKYLDRAPFGEIDVTEEADTLTIRTRNEGNDSAFKFRHVIFERLAN